MIPLPLILSELMLGLGAALVGGTLLALWRPRMGEDGTRVVTAKGRAVVNLFIGSLVLVWGFASFVTKNGI